MSQEKKISVEILAQNGALINLYSAIFAAFYILFAKIALGYVTPYEMALGSSLFVCIICCALYKKSSIQISKTTLFALLIVSLLNAFSELFWFISLSELPPVTLSLLSRMKVVFAFFLSIIIFRDRLNHKELILIISILVGSILFVTRGGELKFDALYVLAALLSSFLYALTYALAKLLHTNISVYSTLFFNSIASLIILSIFFLIYEEHIEFSLEIRPYVMIIASSIFFFLSTALLLKGVHMIPFWQSGVYLKHLRL